MLYWEIENWTWTWNWELNQKGEIKKKKSKPRSLNKKQETFILFLIMKFLEIPWQSGKG